MGVKRVPGVGACKMTTYVRNEKGEFVCPYEGCGVTKARQNTMFYHMKKHAGNMDYVCDVPGCGKSFIQKSGLQQHRLQAHTADAPEWSCPCCDHVSRVKSNLLIHVGRMHGAGWIPCSANDGSCTGCKKTFSSATAYYYHAVQCFKAPDEMADKIAMLT